MPRNLTTTDPPGRRRLGARLRPGALASAILRRWATLSLAVQLGIVACVVTLGGAALLAAFTAYQEAVRSVAVQREQRLRDAELLAERIAGHLVRMQAGARGYALTGDSSFLQAYRAGHLRLADDLNELGALAPAQDSMRRALREYAAAVVRWRIEAAEAQISRREAIGSRVLRDSAFTGLATRATAMADSARATHRDLTIGIRSEAAAARAAAAETAATLQRETQLVGVLVAFGVVLVIVVATRVVTRPLDAIVSAAGALADGRYEAVRLDGVPDRCREIGALSATFDHLALSIAEREQILRSDILQLREVEQLKSDFVSTVSHELRTPLTSIRGSLGLVLGGAAGAVSDRARELLRIALHNTERLIRLINDILDIEKIEGGHAVFRTERCDLAAIARTTAASVHAVAQESRVRLVVDAPRPVSVEGDPDRLVQVVTNLLSNAIKFSPAGEEVRITVSGSKATARLEVTDRGPGIPPEFGPRIFGRFQQAERSDTRHHGGTGLGLSIARAIVEQHRGRIDFESAPNGGTTFRVELPRLEETTPITEPKAANGRPRVLIVESDDGMRDVLRTLCEPSIETVGVGSPEEALAAARTATFDAIVTDLPPHESAVSAIRRIRELSGYADVPMLVFSSREYEPVELAGVTLSPTHAFVKARDPEQDLVMRLRAVLAARGRG